MIVVAFLIALLSTAFAWVISSIFWPEHWEQIEKIGMTAALALAAWAGVLLGQLWGTVCI